jgi:4a-hydroxytetrahydrobiopterin dehydratase
MTALLDDDAIASWLREHATWERDGDTLRRRVDCATFPLAIRLVDAVAEVAEERDHHPDIDIRWRTLHFALSTHSAGGITAKDLDLAVAIDELAQSGGGSGSL